MRKREHELESPPLRWPWVRVAVGEHTLTLRVPSLGVVQRLARPWDAAIAAGDIAAQQEVAGAFLAAAWADPVWALDSDPNDGAGVAEEMHDAGIGFAALVQIMSSLIEASSSRSATESEVKIALDFFGATEAARPGG